MLVVENDCRITVASDDDLGLFQNLFELVDLSLHLKMSQDMRFPLRGEPNNSTEKILEIFCHLQSYPLPLCSVPHHVLQTFRTSPP